MQSDQNLVYLQDTNFGPYNKLTLQSIHNNSQRGQYQNNISKGIGRCQTC